MNWAPLRSMIGPEKCQVIKKVVLGTSSSKWERITAKLLSASLSRRLPLSLSTLHSVLVISGAYDPHVPCPTHRQSTTQKGRGNDREILLRWMELRTRPQISCLFLFFIIFYFFLSQMNRNLNLFPFLLWPRGDRNLQMDFGEKTKENSGRCNLKNL